MFANSSSPALCIYRTGTNIQNDNSIPIGDLSKTFSNSINPSRNALFNRVSSSQEKMNANVVFSEPLTWWWISYCSRSVSLVHGAIQWPRAVSVMTTDLCSLYSYTLRHSGSVIQIIPVRLNYLYEQIFESLSCQITLPYHVCLLCVL